MFLLSSPLFLLCIGVVMMVAGVCLRQNDAGVEYSWWWGFAENSTWLGRLLWSAGVVVVCLALWAVQS